MGPRTATTDLSTAPSLLDIDAVAAALGVTARFVRRLIAERRIPYVKVGKFVRFDRADLDVWLDQGRVAPRRYAAGSPSVRR